MFTTFDLTIIKNEDLSANITGFQVFEPNNRNYEAILRGINLKKENTVKSTLNYKPVNLIKLLKITNKLNTLYIKSIAAFIYDAIFLLSDTRIKNHLASLIKTSKSVSCDTETPWPVGTKIMSNLKENKFDGISGSVRFDESNMRDNLTLAIVDKFKNSVDLVIKFLSAFNSLTAN